MIEVNILIYSVSPLAPPEPDAGRNTRQTAENERHARLTAPRPRTRLTFKLRHCVRSDRSRAGADRTHGLHCSQRNACQFCRAVFRIAASVGKQDFFSLPEQAGGLLALPRISKNRHSVALPCRTPCTVCGGRLSVYDGCPEARVLLAFQRGQRWNPRQLGICGKASLEPLFRAGFGPAPSLPASACIAR